MGTPTEDVREYLTRTPEAYEWSPAEIAEALEHKGHRRATLRRAALRELERGQERVPVALDTDEDTSDAWRHAGDRYEFTIKGHAFDVDEDAVQDLVYWYTYAGQGRTQRVCCALAQERHGLEVTKDFFGRMMRVLGIDKSCPPYAPHRLDKFGGEDLAKLHFQRLQADADTALSRVSAPEYKKMWKAEAKKRLDSDRALELLAGAVGVLRAPDVPRVPVASVPYLAVCAAYDVHVGKLSEDGSGLEETLEAFEGAAVELASRMLAFGAPQKVVVVFGGDYFHVDAITPSKRTGGRTTRGTEQDMAVSGQQMIRAGVRAATRYVNVMRQVAPVDVIVIPGNHDELLSGALLAALELYYEDTHGVSVDVREGSRAYRRWGQTLIGFEHGDGPKPGDVPMVMAHERAADWGACPWRYHVSGHLHHVHERQVGGVTLLQAPSLAKADRWHAKQGYVMARPEHRAYLFCERRGQVATLIAGA